MLKVNITISGQHGAGKTTVLTTIGNALSEQGFNVFYQRDEQITPFTAGKYQPVINSMDDRPIVLQEQLI